MFAICDRFPAAALVVFLAFLTGCDVLVPETGGAVSDGVWNRFNSTAQTDVAIGSVTGEGANRVVMCQYPPSHLAGLYKGTLSPDRRSINWDSQHNLPTYKLAIVGDRMDFVVDVDGDRTILGQYELGSWRGGCNLGIEDGQLRDQSYFVVVHEPANRPSGTNFTDVRIAGNSISLRYYDVPCSNGFRLPETSGGSWTTRIDVRLTDAFGTHTTTYNGSIHQSQLRPGRNRLILHWGALGWMLTPMD
jgi:hypothetical protein